MPLVRVTLIEGRSADVKRALIAEVTETVARVLDAPRPAIRVLLDELPASHWGVGGVSRADAPAQETS